MAYTKHNYQSGDVLMASELNEMDDAIEALDQETTQLKEDLSDSINLTYTKVNLVRETVDHKYPSGSVGGRLSFVNSDSSGYAVVPVEGGKPYSIPLGLSDNFSYWTDSNGIVVLKGLNSVRDTSYRGYVYIAPANASMLYLANLHDMFQMAVVLQTTESLVGKTTSDYPIGEEAALIQVKIPKLVAGADKKNLNDFVDETVPPYYKNLTDKLDNIVSSYSTFSLASISGNVVTVNGVNGGLATNHFTSNSNLVRIRGNITFTTPNLYWQIAYYNGTRWSYLKQTSLDSGVDFEVSFDAANLVVYNSAEEFYIIFNTLTEDGVSDYSGTITANELTINELNAFQQSEYYDENFEPMMQNIFAKLDDGSTTPQVQETTELASVSGEKYILGLGANNAIVLIPKIPNKTLFCGNSLLLGMNTSATNKNYVYGMCASAPTQDFAHKMMATIQSLKPSATYDRVHGAAFEQLASTDNFDTLWNTTANIYTSEPLKNSFTNDLDLIVVQLGDNVNTDDRRTALSTNIGTFLRNVRTASPNARIIWVYGWFSNADTRNIIETACAKYGIQFLNIHSLYTTANQGYSGQTYINGSGEIATVSDNWITHPGDTGFTAIANAIITALGIE